MRPPQITGENCNAAELAQCRILASMRPPQITGENPYDLMEDPRNMDASMRPPQITGENRGTAMGRWRYWLLQ